MVVEEGSSGGTMQTSEEEVREDRRGGKVKRRRCGVMVVSGKTSGGHDCEAGYVAGWLAHFDCEAVSLAG